MKGITMRNPLRALGRWHDDFFRGPNLLEPLEHWTEADWRNAEKTIRSLHHDEVCPDSTNTNRLDYCFQCAPSMRLAAKLSIPHSAAVGILAEYRYPNRNHRGQPLSLFTGCAR